LTIIKFEARNRGSVSFPTKEVHPVPTETIVLIVIIIAIFSVFTTALAWGDYQTRRLPVRK